MHAHRQDMVNVELTKDEVCAAIQRVISEKYPLLNSGWDLQDLNFHDKNLNSCDRDSGGYVGATFFYVKDVEVEDVPVEKKCGESICKNCLNYCR